MNQIELLIIPECSGLDAITVYWHNLAPHHGKVTITCWDCAWTAYFGAMQEKGIKEFFTSSNPSYLVGKLNSTQWLKASKKHDAYLTRIVTAIKQYGREA